jgi:bifunctional DNA-binding transcriptional regulator/antitoxin component of YhaV-PrlF toxin-antitoxin module
LHIIEENKKRGEKMAKMFPFGMRKVSKKYNDYLFVTLPTAYTRVFKIKSGNAFEIYARENGDLILKLVKDDDQNIQTQK